MYVQHLLYKHKKYRNVAKVINFFEICAAIFNGKDWLMIKK